MSAEPEEKPKLNLTINHEGQTIQVKVKATMAFQKVFEAAAKKFSKEPGTLRFVFEGKRIQVHDTPASLGMEDGDQLDAFLAQQGGAAICSNPSALCRHS